MSETVINVTHVRGSNGHNPNSVQGDGASNLGWIQFNIEYFLTHDGILKLVQIVSKECVVKIIKLLTLKLWRIKHLFAKIFFYSYTHKDRLRNNKKHLLIFSLSVIFFITPKTLLNVCRELKDAKCWMKRKNTNVKFYYRFFIFVHADAFS